MIIENTSLIDNRESETKQLLDHKRNQRQALDRWLQENGHNLYPSKEQKEKLGRLTDMSYGQIGRWFANRRRKFKMASSRSHVKSESPCSSISGELPVKECCYAIPKEEIPIPADMTGCPLKRGHSPSIFPPIASTPCSYHRNAAPVLSQAASIRGPAGINGLSTTPSLLAQSSHNHLLLDTYSPIPTITDPLYAQQSNFLMKRNPDFQAVQPHPNLTLPTYPACNPFPANNNPFMMPTTDLNALITLYYYAASLPAINAAAAAGFGPLPQQQQQIVSCNEDEGFSPKKKLDFEDNTIEDKEFAAITVLAEFALQKSAERNSIVGTPPLMLDPQQSI